VTQFVGVSAVFLQLDDSRNTKHSAIQGWNREVNNKDKTFYKERHLRFTCSLFAQERVDKTSKLQYPSSCGVRFKRALYRTC